MITERQFKRLNAFQKGFVVYMLGARTDEPHVPESYEPTVRERAHYEFGQQSAVIEAQDDA